MRKFAFGTEEGASARIVAHRGELLTPAEMASATPAERAAHAGLRKASIVLEADEAVVLRTLEAQMAAAEPTIPVATA